VKCTARPRDAVAAHWCQYDRRPRLCRGLPRRYRSSECHDQQFTQQTSGAATSGEVRRIRYWPRSRDRGWTASFTPSSPWILEVRFSEPFASVDVDARATEQRRGHAGADREPASFTEGGSRADNGPGWTGPRGWTDRLVQRRASREARPVLAHLGTLSLAAEVVRGAAPGAFVSQNVPGALETTATSPYSFQQGDVRWIATWPA
jgi:hypothetical protein